MLRSLNVLEIDMASPTDSEGATWITKGKTIRQLISELQTFSDLDMEVRISIDQGDTTWPISLVGRAIVETDTLAKGALLRIVGKATHMCVLSYEGALNPRN